MVSVKGLFCPHWSVDVLFPMWAAVWMRLDTDLGWDRLGSHQGSEHSVCYWLEKSLALQPLCVALTRHLAFFLLIGIKVLMLFWTFSRWRSSSKIRLTQWHGNFILLSIWYVVPLPPSLYLWKVSLSIQNPWLLLCLMYLDITRFVYSSVVADGIIFALHWDIIRYTA